MTNASSMSEEFHEWLDKCPVQWFRIKNDTKGNSEYSFHEERKED